MSKQFGEFISLKDADGIFQRFQNVKTEYGESMKKIFKHDPDAISTYAGDYNAFVFSKEQLSALLARIDNSDDIIAIYPGIRNDDTTNNPRQTIICAAYKFSQETKTFDLVKGANKDGNDDVLEHSGSDEKVGKTILNAIQMSFPEGSIHSII